MSLFRKKETCVSNDVECNENIQSIKVLGTGCKSCHALYENAKTAVSEMGLGIEVEYITDIEKIMSYGVMSMPVLVVNEQVVSRGKVVDSEGIKSLIGNR